MNKMRMIHFEIDGHKFLPFWDRDSWKIAWSFGRVRYKDVINRWRNSDKTGDIPGVTYIYIGSRKMYDKITTRLKGTKAPKNVKFIYRSHS